MSAMRPKFISILFILEFLIILSSVLHPSAIAYISIACSEETSSIIVTRDDHGINVTLPDKLEFYFNASNGGEITEYYDLHVDPLRRRNLVDLSLGCYHNLLPLFATMFYYSPSDSPTGFLISTAGDPVATVEMMANTSQYLILQTSSRIMSHDGLIARDAGGNVIRVNSTWIIYSNASIFVERTLSMGSYATVPPLWRWYPFYLTRVLGFDYNGTFYMFNTTVTQTFVTNKDEYTWRYLDLPQFLNDTNSVFGVAVPFANTSIGGDGTHNFLLAYKYSDLINVNEWRSDNFNQASATETGAVHKFSEAFNISTHTYHMMMRFTHQPIDENNVRDFLKFFASVTRKYYLMEINVKTDKSVYNRGDSYAIYGSGLSYYNLTGVSSKLTVKDSLGTVILTKYYRPSDLIEGHAFNRTLRRGTVSQGSKTGNYTITLQTYSSLGIIIASDSQTIQVI